MTSPVAWPLALGLIAVLSLALIFTLARRRPAPEIPPSVVVRAYVVVEPPPSQAPPPAPGVQDAGPPPPDERPTARETVYTADTKPLHTSRDVGETMSAMKNEAFEEALEREKKKLRGR